ncbi:unnamed protein product [Macrosiphum euphorbiae]|uniref:Uncharacterized protein n=1 Tax=Macrosiphum euphorbiae TaxID=13131 RepID=A0AAV0X7U3_9HEMI|nr:unnamed protein product [Macrosiphum euphorbiae]
MAQQRFFNLEKRLSKYRELCIAYHKFMSEYLNMNHMELVTNDDSNSQTYYLPHHAVIKRDSITTKLRVVFDGSAPTISGLSLNDVMLKEPMVKLLRFRVHKIALTADVEKMYRQILVTPKDCQLQRIWYRPSPSGLLREYNLRTITYITKSASYLATRILVEIAFSAIKDDFYVNDLLTCAESSDECFQLYKDVSDTSHKKGSPRKFLQTLQPSGGDKENLVGTCRFHEHNSDPKMKKMKKNGPNEKYWEVIADRRRKVLEEVLEQNRKLHTIVMALEEENTCCKKLLKQITDLVNTLKEVLNEEDDKSTEFNVDNYISSINSNQINSNDDFSGSESE